jgi:hypothetical protein
MTSWKVLPVKLGRELHIQQNQQPYPIDTTTMLTSLVAKMEFIFTTFPFLQPKGVEGPQLSQLQKMEFHYSPIMY